MSFNFLGSLAELIGKECSYNFAEDSNEWNPPYIARCKIIGIEIEIGDVFGEVSVSVKLDVLDDSDIDEDDRAYLWDSGTSLEFIRMKKFSHQSKN